MANNCRIFTSTEYANELLDAVGYRGSFGKEVLIEDDTEEASSVLLSLNVNAE